MIWIIEEKEDRHWVVKQPPTYRQGSKVNFAMLPMELLDPLKENLIKHYASSFGFQ